MNAQKDGYVAMVEIVRTQGLDARLGPHGHEDGGRKNPVGCGDFTQARAARFIAMGNSESKHSEMYYSKKTGCLTPNVEKCENVKESGRSAAW